MDYADHCESRPDIDKMTPVQRLEWLCIRFFRIEYTNHLILKIPSDEGIPNLLIPESRHGYNGLWIFATDSKLNRKQKEARYKLRDHGNLVLTAEDIHGFAEIIDDYFS